MRLGDSIFEEVRKRAPFKDRLEQVFASKGGLQIRCEMSEADRLGCALTHLELVKETKQTVDPKQLIQRVDRLCGKVTYLQEPLRTIEVDARSHTVLVRSVKPRERDDQLSYYELIANDDLHLSLRRYSYSRVERSRSPVSFILSSDQMDMLLGDLLETVADSESN